MNKTELEELQAYLHMQARKVMDNKGHWVDPKETVVVYRTGRIIDGFRAARQANGYRDE